MEERKQESAPKRCYQPKTNMQRIWYDATALQKGFGRIAGLSNATDVNKPT